MEHAEASLMEITADTEWTLEGDRTLFPGFFSAASMITPAAPTQGLLGVFFFNLSAATLK